LAFNLSFRNGSTMKKLARRSSKRDASALADLGAFARYIRGLRGYLRQTLSVEDGRRRLQRQLATREEAFLRILEQGVFAYPRSPYRELFRQAGVELGDAVRLVREHGIEGALGQLHDAGVRVTLDEFKGRRSITRPGLERPVSARDFDNPLLTKHYEARTGASRSPGRRINVDLDFIAHEAAHHAVFLAAFDMLDRPWALWHAVPPAGPGIKNSLMQAKLGRQVERWFSTSEVTPRAGALKFFLFTRATVKLSQMWGHPVPMPEYTPLEEAIRVARWLAAKRAAGTPAVLSASTSAGVRACLAAMEHGLDVAGTVFHVGGEPFTPAKANVIDEAGGRAVNLYAMAEAGWIGFACSARSTSDYLHVLSDKVAVIQREKQLGANETPVGSLLYTTLLPSSPKLMLNVDVGDYGKLDEEPCGCALGELGFKLGISGVGSYDKLTSEGDTFLGSDLITLVEETLPAGFGGRSTDYQLVEEEEESGLPKVSIVVSPRLGEVDEEEIVATVLRALRANPDTRQMAEIWRDGRTLRVARREPSVTSGSKILPLHVAR
jgi:hypothetical protein